MVTANDLSGEERLIARYFRPLAKHLPPWDFSMTPLRWSRPAGCDFVLKMDGLISGVHFFPDDPADVVAKKALRVNLSDLARPPDPATSVDKRLIDTIANEQAVSCLLGEGHR